MAFNSFTDAASEYLKQELKLRMQGRQNYSLRKFAQDLEMSPGTLVDFLKGRLGFSKSRADFVAQEIKLSPEQREHFWNLIEAKFARSPQMRLQAKTKVELRLKNQKPSLNGDLTSHWYHTAILELIDLDESLAMPHRLAPVIGVSVAEARGALDRLFKVGFLKNLNGKTKINEQMAIANEDLPIQVLRQVQTQFLNLAQKAVESQSQRDRENFAAFVTINKNDLPVIKQQLRDAFFKVMQPHLNSENRDSVFCFGMQMFKIYEIEQKIELKIEEDNNFATTAASC